MKLTSEQKTGVIILFIGILLVVRTQIMINKHGGLVHVNITPTVGKLWHEWRPLEYTMLDCPSYLVYQQMMGIFVSAVGATLLISPLIFQGSQPSL